MGYKAGEYDVAVIGAGHAGIEAALASARLGASTVIFTIKTVSTLISLNKLRKLNVNVLKNTLTVNPAQYIPKVARAFGLFLVISLYLAQPKTKLMVNLL